MKISQRSGGAPDSEQYLFGVHWTVQCAPDYPVGTKQSKQRGPQPGTLERYSTGQSGQQSDPTVDCYRPQRSADVARAPDLSDVHRTVGCTRR
jgi:hypothetical protein